MALFGFPLDISQIAPQTMGIFVVFAIALYFIFKTVKFVMTGVMVAIAAAIFPFLANIMGMNIPISVQGEITFIIWGVVLYVVATFAKKILAILKTITWPIRKLFGR